MDNLNCVNIILKGLSMVTGVWVKGDLLREFDANGKLHYFIHQAWSPAVTTKHEIDPNTICRWTGFTNFKKEDIWEYDILEYVGPAKSDKKLRGLVYNAERTVGLQDWRSGAYGACRVHGRYDKGRYVFRQRERKQLR